ncbi:MAG: hypothetical protein Kow0032_14210 [Methyloligellaceae bacterium]
MADEQNAPPAPRYSDPFSALRAEMENLFDNYALGRLPALPRSFSQLAGETAFVPSVDVRENDREIIIEAELPGIDEKDVSVTLDNGLLTIKGEKKIEKSVEKEDFHAMERRYGSFRRVMRVPESVDQDKVSATYDKGVLKVVLAKKSPTQGGERKIEITSR